MMDGWTVVGDLSLQLVFVQLTIHLFFIHLIIEKKLCALFEFQDNYNVKNISVFNCTNKIYIIVIK